MELNAILLLGFVALLWRAMMGARERALGVARGLCKDTGVTLLDDTISLINLRLVRDRKRQFRLQRVYAFEYTHGEFDRCPGQLLFVGEILEGVCLDGKWTLPPG